LDGRRSLSPVVRQGREELWPLRAKRLLDRGDPAGAAKLLASAIPSPLVQNLQGVAAAMRQDFDAAIGHFQAALPQMGEDARVQQNLAIVRGWLGEPDKAAGHWRRFLESFAA